MTRPARALFVHSSNEMYGADYILYSLLSARDTSSWDVHVILPCDVPYEGRLSRKFDDSGISWEEMKLAVLRRRYFTPAGLPRYSAYFARSVQQILRRIREGNYDIVHSNTTAVVPGAVAARLARKPHVWHAHEMVVSPGFVRKSTARMAVKLSDVVIAVSEAVRQHMLQDAPDGVDTIRVLRNGIELDRFQHSDGRERVRQEFGFSPDDVVAGTLGRISKFKGQEYLVEAASRLQDRPNLKFLLVGDPFVGQEYVLDNVRSKVRDHDLENQVVISPFRSDSPDLYAAMDISVLPSVLPDPFPTVVLEAMAAGKPLVATNWGGAAEMVAEGESGFLVPVDAPQVLAERISRLADSADLRTRMGSAGRHRAQTLFTRERMVKEFWDLMSQTLRS